ncbi:hypothetical protein DK427_06120 [Methylobacterium radiodurans]|uniref:Uncharacterized protein n=2 Tax=Methylobacterium radiodurans TaxID=2202828 RepID=A0A2U8W071_9HYPH|nr:hypothetical protein DK427_06120 [Methylobacterium radiodurans]
MRHPPTDTALRDLILAQLAEPGTAWSLGTFGAAAEFRRGPDEPARPLADGRLGLCTARGGIALVPHPDLVPVAYETALPGGWSHAVALCLPETALPHPRRGAVTALGLDREALDPDARDEPLFDLGLGLGPVALLARAGDAEGRARLAALGGAPLPDPDAFVAASGRAGHPALVFAGPLGRVEVLRSDGPPPGPRAHAVAQVLRLGRTHVATAPIPPGLVPCAHIQPPHPLRDGAGAPCPFRRAHHDAFQTLLERWGDPALVALKRHRLGLGPDPGLAPDRRTRAVARVAAAQIEAGAYPEPRGTRGEVTEC